MAPDMIWHIYSGQHCFKGTLGMDLLSSRDDALMMGQVPCEFWGDQSNFIFQPAAADVIWHIYSGQHCFKGVLGMDLLSSGDDALMMGQVPCEFQGDWQTFIFQPAAPDVIRHLYCGQGWRYGPAIFRGCCTHQGTCRGPSPDQGALPLKTASGWCHPPLSSTAWSKCAKSRQELPAEKWRLANLLEIHRGPATWWGQHPLKTAGPYLKPPWSSAGRCKCPKSHQEPPAEKWRLANLLETHREPSPW